MFYGLGKKGKKKKTWGGGGGGNYPSLYVRGLRHQKTSSRKQSQHAFFTLSSSLYLQFLDASTKYTIIFPIISGSKLDEKAKQPMN